MRDIIFEFYLRHINIPAPTLKFNSSTSINITPIQPKAMNNYFLPIYEIVNLNLDYIFNLNKNSAFHRFLTTIHPN